jgi:DNA-3-methyladenine glycosylase II
VGSDTSSAIAATFGHAVTALDENGRARARRALMRRDPILADVIRRVGPCRMEHRGDPYRMLLRSVIYQQLAGAAARKIDGRLRAPWRGRYPRPEVMLAAPETQLRAAGLSRQKIAAVRSVAEAFAAGDVTNRRLRAMDDEAVIGAVTKIHGIGEWTAHMLLMFSLGRPDVLPVGDYGVRKGAMKLYRLRDLPKPSELEALAAPWRPYRSIGSWYLWRVVDTIAPGQ